MTLSCKPIFTTAGVLCTFMNFPKTGVVVALQQANSSLRLQCPILIQDIHGNL